MDCGTRWSIAIVLTMQFTLCHVLKGNKPDFHNALTSEQSEPMYQEFLKLLRSMHRAEAIKGELKHRCYRFGVSIHG